MSRCVALVTLWCSAAWGQALEPRPAARDYPAHSALDRVSLGAEYLVRSVSGEKRTFFLNDYLVVEVALFPAPGRPLEVSLSHFRLQVGGKKGKETLVAVGPQFVAAALKYPDWERRRRLEAVGGVGDSGVILGRPPAVERFPGDPTGRSRLPAPPRAPEADPRVETEPPVSAAEVVVRYALPEGEASVPRSGYLYFPYPRKTKDLRSVELVYQGPAGAATLRLR